MFKHSSRIVFVYSTMINTPVLQGKTSLEPPGIFRDQVQRFLIAFTQHKLELQTIQMERQIRKSARTPITNDKHNQGVSVSASVKDQLLY